MFNRLATLIAKELQLAFRDPQSRRLLVLPVILQLALFPFAARLNSGIDILLSGVSAGTIAYAVHWWREQQ